MIIQKFNQEDTDFWNLMGRHFASAAIRRELGVPMSSNESYKWLLAFESGEVIGFCSITPAKDHEKIQYLYALPEHKGQNVELKLLKQAIKSKATKKAIVAPEELKLWQQAGFTATGKTKGKYLEVALG